MDNTPIISDRVDLAFDLKSYLTPRRQKIDQALMAFLRTNQTKDSRIVSAMRYSINAGGKRLRPILCMAAAHAVGGNEEEALPACCALEMIHTYSLIHDDLPAMDDDDLRRGQPTCHRAFDEATAILAGDALLTGAFQLLAEHATEQPAEKYGSWLSIITLISRASGHHGMIEGQMRDIESEGRSIDLIQLEKLHRLKTGALISASVLSGASIGGASEAIQSRLEQYAHCIGLAFQVTDDILNEEGDPRVMGKAAGTDQIRMKNTYPALMGIEAAKQKAAELVGQALKSIDIFDNKSDPLRAIARYVAERQR